MSLTGVYVGLGSNLGDREALLRKAVGLFSHLLGLSVTAVSSIYETKPRDLPEQPDFLNAVARVEAGVSPEDLLAGLKRVERLLGRTPGVRFGPRAIDLDLLLVDGVRVNTPTLTVPHPRMWQRAFVLVPLAELAPDLQCPSGRRVAEEAARLAGEQGVRLWSAWPGELPPRDWPNVARICSCLGGRNVYLLEEATSTNDVALELARSGEPAGSVVVASVQTGGRGRGGHRWFSPKGGLWMSVIERPRIPAARASLIPLLGSAAACKAVQVACGVDAKIKWPNDLVVRGKKLGGVLVESGCLGGQVRFVVVGIGVNVNVALFPADLGIGATSTLIETGKVGDLGSIAAALVTDLESRLACLERSRPEACLAEVAAECATIGTRVTWGKDTRLSGVACGIAPSGHLVVRLNDGSTAEVRPVDCLGQGLLEKV